MYVQKMDSTPLIKKQQKGHLMPLFKKILKSLNAGQIFFFVISIKHICLVWLGFNCDFLLQG